MWARTLDVLSTWKSDIASEGLGRWLEARYLDASLHAWQPPASPTGAIDGLELWRQYRVRTRVSSCILRTAPHAVLLLGLVVVLWFFGESWTSPARGEFARKIDRYSFVLSWCLSIALVLYVIDATRVFERFTRLLSERQTDWGFVPRKTGLMADRGLPDSATDDLLDVELIARHSAVVGRLVLSPFVLFVVFLLARNPYFDRWSWPPALVFALALLLAGTLVPAILLRRAAESARQSSLRRLREKSSGCGNDDAMSDDGKTSNGTLRRRLLLAHDEIQRFDVGAFSPYSKSPILQAMLLPFGGVGLVALLEGLIVLGI